MEGWVAEPLKSFMCLEVYLLPFISYLQTLKEERSGKGFEKSQYLLTFTESSEDTPFVCKGVYRGR